MNTVQKAKAYDAAVKEASIAYKDEDRHLKATLEQIFPELKESEDEKIRKELLEHCKNQAKLYIQTGNKCPQIQSWIAWLEKQGKEPVWTDNDRTMTFTLLRDVEQMTYISNEGKNERLEWLNTLEDKFKED